jgi:hypothetical protein
MSKPPPGEHMGKARPNAGKFVQVKTLRVPAVFGRDPNEVFLMKLGPRAAFKELVSGTGSVKDWCIVLDRLAIGRELAINFYEEETAKELHAVIVAFSEVLAKYAVSKQWLGLVDVEGQVTGAMDAVDQIQDGITHREFNLVRDNALSVNVTDFDELLLPWNEYVELRRRLLIKHGRKVTIKA